MKLILALSLLVCVTFQVGKCDTIGQNIDQAIDWTENKMSGAYDAMKNTAGWVEDQVQDIMTDSSEEDVSSDIGAIVSDAYQNIKDTVANAAADISTEIDAST